MVDALIANGKSVSYCNVQSDCGHDAFLLKNQLDVYGALIRSFLENLDEAGGDRSLADHVQNSTAGGGDSEPVAPSSPAIDATSIFHDHRLDYDTILDMIPGGASVLDLGCGTGGLLARLRDRGHRRIMGIEWDEQAIMACVAPGPGRGAGRSE